MQAPYLYQAGHNLTAKGILSISHLLLCSSAVLFLPIFGEDFS